MGTEERKRDGVSLMAEAIRKELQEKEESQGTQQLERNVTDVTAQFSTAKSTATGTQGDSTMVSNTDQNDETNNDNNTD